MDDFDPVLKLMENCNLEFAVGGEVSRDLKECLMRLRKIELETVALRYHIPNRGHMRKEKLTARLLESLTREDEIEPMLITASDCEWELWQRLYQKGVLRDNCAAPGAIAYFLSRGLFYSFASNGHISYAIPDQIALAYARMLNNGFAAKRDRYMIVMDYATATTSLYGAIGINRLYDMIAGQNDIAMEYAEYLNILMQHSLNKQDFSVLNGYVVSTFLEDEKELEILIDKTNGKPNFQLPKEKLLAYAEDGILEPTPELLYLRNFFTDKMGMDRESAIDLAEEMAGCLRMDFSFNCHFELFERRNLRFKDIQQVREAAGLILGLSNSVRKWITGGFTAKEISRDEGEPLITEAKFEIKSSLILHAPDKNVGRNDPCPCGSGIKYKRCCGRNN